MRRWLFTLGLPAAAGGGPQEGRVRVNVSGKPYDIRLRIRPTDKGPSAVLHFEDVGQSDATGPARPRRRGFWK